jgi:hypothetical protein
MDIVDDYVPYYIAASICEDGGDDVGISEGDKCSVHILRFFVQNGSYSPSLFAVIIFLFSCIVFTIGFGGLKVFFFFFFFFNISF